MTMKKISFATILTISTILSACGGGGGGHGYVPPTTLPDNPDISACTNPETCMTTQKFSNSEKRIELYQNSENQASTFSMFSFRAPMSDDAMKEKVDAAYQSMKNILIDGQNGSNEELKKALLLAGIDAEEINKHLTDLQDWAEINVHMIKGKAQDIWNRYGVEKEVSLDNAKLNVVNIDSKQDSFVSFTVDDKGKIESLHFDVDKDSADARTMTLTKVGDGKFSRTGESYVYGVRVGVNDSSIYPDGCNVCTSNGHTLELELFETPKDIAEIRKMLIASLYENKNNYQGSEEDINKFISDTIAWINKLELADFTGDNLEVVDSNNAFKDGGVSTTTVTYKSYAKNIGENGLKYSDFGIVGVDAKEGTADVNESFVFAGGLDAKRIAKNDIQGKMNFEGKAVAAVLHQDYSDSTGSGAGGRKEYTKSYEGTANLEFDNGKETLNTDFTKDGWYNVQVTSNAARDNYDIKFSGGENISAEDEIYKFSSGNDFTKTDFVGNPGGADYPYGAIDIGYYGDKTPEEATGYVAYGENVDVNKDVHAQIGFGTQIKK